MLVIQRPTVEALDEGEGTRQQFAIGPLEPGFGHTMGNSLRRTLLSSIPGAAITSVRFDDALHEFDTIRGVAEDVTDIILNLKGLVVSSEEDEPVTMYLRKQGPGAVTAGDIVPPANVTVHNPDMHIATLNDKGKLEVELVVERVEPGAVGVGVDVVGPHDEGVLAEVLVVVLPHTGRGQPEAAVQLDGRLVGGADLQGEVVRALGESAPHQPWTLTRVEP